MLCVEQLYQETKKLLLHSKSKSPAELFAEIGGGVTLEGAQHFLSLIDDAIIEVEACQFKREDKGPRYISELQTFKAKLLETMINRDRGSKGPLFSEGSVERIGAICEAVTEALDDTVAKLDRSGFSEATRALQDEIQNWNIGEYEKRSLLLSLNMLIAQSAASEASFSDNEIRRRVKLVVAGFAVEFSTLDREFETWFESIKRWAKLGYQGSSVPLGITNQSMKIAGLLTGPK
tara:strand:- start:1322 stop:2023 length:702 start_codon:yes stop_codon:yes gene_type:complete